MKQAYGLKVAKRSENDSHPYYVAKIEGGRCVSGYYRDEVAADGELNRIIVDAVKEYVDRICMHEFEETPTLVG
jgi:hypothetical protein